MESHGEALREAGASEELVRALKQDWRRASLSETDRAICAYAAKLTESPGDMQIGDVVRLRAVGLNEMAIHDVCAVTAYFAYINRIADGLGVDLEPDMNPKPLETDDRGGA